MKGQTAFNMYQANPTDRVPQAKQIKTPLKALNEQDLNRLLRTIYKSRRKRDIAILQLMAGAGLRIGEVEALKVLDVQVSDSKV